jgi:hypothetical protein
MRLQQCGQDSWAIACAVQQAMTKEAKIRDIAAL